MQIQVHYTVSMMEDAMAQLRAVTTTEPGANLAPIRDEDGKVRLPLLDCPRLKVHYPPQVMIGLAPRRVFSVRQPERCVNTHTRANYTSLLIAGSN